MGLPCCIGAFIGSRFINEYVNRTKRSAFLLFILLYLLILSGVILIAKTSYGVFVDFQNDRNIFEIKNYCSLR
jgi:hypothetical protein